MATELLIARGKHQCRLLLGMANRHGLIAERLSQSGVAVFMAEVKGDLSGIAGPGGGNPKVSERVE